MQTILNAVNKDISAKEIGQIFSLKLAGEEKVLPYYFYPLIVKSVPGAKYLLETDSVS